MSKHVLSWLLMLLLIGQAYAQDRQVSGTIRDERGQPMPGANVVLKGTTRGTNSDADGVFRISVPGGSTTLTISSVGYLTQDVPVGASETQLSVALQPDSRTLNEVVVTALGIERQAKTLTYATQKVDGRQLTDVRDANFVNTLQGKVAGLVVTQGAGGPGSATRVTLRGNRSIRGNNNALFVVDGVPIDNTIRGQVGSDFGGTNFSDGAANINPDDIESMNVLKGAAASALYGSRAANGVIMITTKKGKAGRVSADVNSGVAVETPMILPELQNEYAQGNGGVNNDKASGSWGARGGTFYPDNIRDFFRRAISTNNSFGVSGGTDRTQTYLSYTHNLSQGIVPNNDLTRHTLNLRLNNQITSRLTTDAKITYINQNINNKVKVGEESGVVMNLYKIPRSVDLARYEQFEDEQGNPTYWTTSSIYMNPYWTINRTTETEKRNRVIALGSARYNFTDWLNIQGRISFDRFDDKINRRFWNKTLLFAQEGGSLFEITNETLERNLDVILSGNNKIGETLALTYNVGAGQTYQKFTQIGSNARGLLVPNKFDLNFARTIVPISSLSEKELQYVFGTASLTYRDYLTLDLTARNDWSSTLPKPYSYFYPSVGVTAILSDMMPMPDWVSFLKVRGSYTRVGNDTDPYLLLQTYSFSQGGTGGFVQRDDIQPAENLKPEISSSLEFGLDWRLFNGRLGIDATWYKTNTVNQLLTLGLAPASGFSNQFINAGNIENRGFEIALTAKPLTGGPLTWDMGLNISRNVNEIIELHPDIKLAFLAGGFGRTAGPVVAEGGSYGDMYAQRWKRDPQGRFVVDANGKPVATGNEMIGNFNPKFMLGFSNTFNYKNFVATLLFDGRFGGTMTSGTDANLAFDGNAPYTTANREGNWTLPAVIEKTVNGQPVYEPNNKAINAETFWTTVSGGRYSWGEFFTYSTTNVRLRELSVGYNVNLPSNFFIKSARLSVVGRNLFFLYRGYATLDIPGVPKRRLPFDPDVNLGAGNFQGVEYGNLPSTRTLGLNLKLAF